MSLIRQKQKRQLFEPIYVPSCEWWTSSPLTCFLQFLMRSTKTNINDPLPNFITDFFGMFWFKLSTEVAIIKFEIILTFCTRFFRRILLLQILVFEFYLEYWVRFLGLLRSYLSRHFDVYRTNFRRDNFQADICSFRGHRTFKKIEKTANENLVFHHIINIY